MSEDKDKIELIKKHEPKLVELYAEIYPSLRNINRNEWSEEQLSELDQLDPPKYIKPSKAVAILQAICGGSKPPQMFALETFFSVPMRDGNGIGGYIREKLRELGIGYNDFFPYLTESGWLQST